MINTSKDRHKLFLDLLFYGLGLYAFYRNIVLSASSVILILFLYRYTKYYDRDSYFDYLDSFIDFLNQINSGLSSGFSIESSILQSLEELEKDGSEKETYMRRVLFQTASAIRLGLNGDILFDEIRKFYPIEDSKLYIKMLKLGKVTGASMNHITETVLSQLYMRFRTISESNLIVYQKKIEQQILCVAPIFIILFVSISSGEFLEILYTTHVGCLIMTLSFCMLLVMKFIGRRIVLSIR